MRSKLQALARVRPADELTSVARTTQIFGLAMTVVFMALLLLNGLIASLRKNPVAQYRRFASDYRRLAAMLANPADKLALELMATGWDNVANRAKRCHKTIG
jgi:hypothetical protein